MQEIKDLQGYDQASLDERASEIFRENQLAVWKRTDRMFAYLMIVQWVASVLVALWISPRTWVGSISDVHIHVWTALLLGGVITAFPVTLAFLEPGRTVTRHCVACGQLLISCLLIHLTGGRIETHFHVFCSLAFLSLYRDWRVLILPTLIVGTDHFIRGLIWPLSVYGVNVVQPYRWVEHVGWVLFEDAVLIFSSIKASAEQKMDAFNQARLEQTKRIVEDAVIERTAELEEARDQALDASKTKSQFVANISHEVRTPMSGIIGMTELLLRDENDAEREERLQSVLVNAQSLMSILNDILDFSKLEAGKISIESVSFSPGLLVEEVTHFMLPKAVDKGIMLRASCADELPRLALGDLVRLRQILLNLLSNAIKFTDNGGVTVSASLLELKDDRAVVRFEVIDTGRGMDEKQQTRLFQPFEQLDAASTRRHGGTGLGLSISKHLVELMDGEIGVESQLGRGTTFWLNIPLTIVRSHKTNIPTSPGKDLPETRRTKGGTLLVVEDNKVLVQIIKAQLSGSGYQLETACDGKEALAIYLSKELNLILMDCQMPELDGYQATAAIRDIEAKTAKHVPIVAMTASAMSGDREKCLRAGMDDYLCKPFTPEGLIAMIDKWMQPRGFNDSKEVAEAPSDLLS